MIASLVADNARGMLDVLVRRVEGIGDDELHWEPVSGCLGVRDGAMDALPREPHHFDATFADPLTTIAWRLAHIAGDGLLASRNAAWLGLHQDVVPPPATPVPMTGDAMVEWLRSAVDFWCDLVASLDDAHLAAPIGAVGGPFAEASRAAFVLHIGNDTTHHGGEVGLLRDLWRAGVR